MKIQYSYFPSLKIIRCKRTMFENFNISENSTYIISVEVVAKVLW
jgi:hypothetical protein